MHCLCGCARPSRPAATCDLRRVAVVVIRITITSWPRRRNRTSAVFACQYQSPSQLPKQRLLHLASARRSADATSSPPMLASAVSISAQSQRRLSTAPLPADAPPRSANATSGHRRRGIAARPAAPRRVHNRRAVPRNNRVHCADRAVCRRNRTSAKARADAFWVGCRSPPRTHMGICRQHEPPWAEGTHTRVPCHLASSGDTKQIDPAQAIKPRFGSP